MRIDIQALGFPLTAPLPDQTERRLRFALTRTSARIERVMVRLRPPLIEHNEFRAMMNNPAASCGVSKPKTTPKVSAPRGGELNLERD